MKKIIIATSFIFIIILSSCSNKQEIDLKKENIIKKTYDSISVSTWNIDDTKSFIGNIVWNKEIDISSKASWKIMFLNKNIWDYVYEWELIATLDSSEAIVQYNSSKKIEETLSIMKDSSKKSLESEIDMTKEKIKQVEAWIIWINKAIENSIIINDKNILLSKNTIKQAEIWLSISIKNLEETKNILDWKKEDIIKNTKHAITKSLILNSNIINFTDELLWITQENKYKNNWFEEYLGFKNISLKNTNESLFIEINILLKEYRTSYENKIENNNDINEKEIIEILKKWENLSLKTQILLKNTYDILNNSIDNINFTLNTINWYKNQILMFWQQIDSSLLTIEWEYILWLKGSLQNIDSINKEAKKNIKLLEEQVELAKETIESTKKAYDILISNNKMTIDDLKTKKNIAEIGLNEAKIWLIGLENWKDTKINEIETKIIQANWEKNLSEVMIENWKVYSPISWIIKAKMIEKWQIIWWWTPIYTIASNSIVKLEIEIDDETIKKLELNQKLNVEINWKNYKWVITNLINIKNPINKRNPIEIIIDNTNNEIKIWSKANVKIDNFNQNENIIIPHNAILEKFLVAWVYVIKENKAIFTKIKIIKSNDEYNEITWLKVWDIVITDGKENISDGEIIK